MSKLTNIIVALATLFFFGMLVARPLLRDASANSGLTANVISTVLAANGISPGSTFPVPVEGVTYHIDRLHVEDHGSGEFSIAFKASPAR